MDYYKAGTLSQTFKNVVHVSITQDLEKIVVPTLIIWGRNDAVTPLADGEYMNKHIVNSKLVIISNMSHKLPYENPAVFAEEVLKFLA